jgi:Tol biopolymer transport system component
MGGAAGALNVGGAAGALNVGGEAGGSGVTDVPQFGPPRALVQLHIDPQGGAGGALGYEEDDPCFTADRLELYYAIRRGELGNDEDIYVSKRLSTTEPWGAPTRVEELRSGGTDGTPIVSPDGLTIWFASTRAGGAGGMDIWSARRNRRSAPWSAPTYVAALSSPEGDKAPAISTNLLEMVVASTRGGAARGFDLYLTRRSSGTAPWTAPRALLELNGAGEESSGQLVKDGLGIVFAAERPAGTPSKLYYASRSGPTARFGSVTALTGLASPDPAAEDRDPWVSAELDYIVFASNRSGRWQVFEASR